MIETKRWLTSIKSKDKKKTGNVIGLNQLIKVDANHFSAIKLNQNQ